MGDARAIPPLLTGIYGEQWTGCQFIRALAEIDDPCVNELLADLLGEDTPDDQRAEAAAALLRRGDARGLDALQQIALDNASSGQTIALVALTAAADDPHNAVLLQPLTPLAALQAYDPLNAVLAGSVLAKLHDPRAISCLLNAATDHEDMTACLALKFLAGAQTPFAAASLLAQLPTAPLERQAGILAALGASGDPAAVPVLLPYLHDENPRLRQPAVEALGKLHATEAVTPLTTLLQHEEVPTIRAAAAAALATITGKPSPSHQEIN